MFTCKFFNKKSVLSLYYREIASLTQTNVKNQIAEVKMCHKETRNSLSIAMMTELINHLNKFGEDTSVRVIILAAEGNIFSAGHNLKELNTGRQQQEKVFEVASQLMNSLIDCPVPVIAKVDGMAAAAGCQLVAQCDLAFCTENSSFSTPGANFGIFCSTPGVALARSIPKATAMKMLLTGAPISAREAEAKGLITKVCDNLDKDIGEVSNAIIAKSRSVISLGKRFYYKQINKDVKEAYKIGGEIMVKNLQTDDGKEGLNSFTEKRKPIWK